MNSEVLSNLVITKVNSVFTLYSEKGREGRRCSRPRWGIGIKYEGETVYTSNGADCISNANNIVVLPKGSNYEWKSIVPGHFFMLEFESDLECDSIFGFQVKNGDRLLKLFREIDLLLALKRPGYTLESIRDVYSVIISLMQAAPKKYIPSEKQAKIAPALDCIAQNYNKKMTNDDLASLCGISTVYFRKLFAETLGVSPIDYIHSLRISKAKEMLKSDYTGIGDIALALGYPNIYDFSRTFKKHVGVSPAKYKES